MVKSPSASARMPKHLNVRNIKWNLRYPYVLLFSLLSAGYILLSLLPKPDKTVLQHYHLSHAGYYWIVVPVVIYIVCVWTAGLFGSLIFKSYSNSIKKTSDGSALNTLSLGLLFLTATQPLTAGIAAGSGLIGRHHQYLVPTLTKVSNYLAIILLGVSFAIIAIGAEKLYRLVSVKSRSAVENSWVLGFIILSSLYSYFIVIQPVHTPFARRVYYLSDWMLVATIAVPYLIIWYFGLSAAYRIYRFQSGIRGWIYKSALRYLASGIALVIISSVSTRAITTISSRLSQLSLTPVLFIVYGLILLDGAGFILIAVGARKLRKIEEV